MGKGWGAAGRGLRGLFGFWILSICAADLLGFLGFWDT